MFALFAFGALFGFVGLLIAVPASAAIGVLARFGLSQYLQSELYNGQGASNGRLAAAPRSEQIEAMPSAKTDGDGQTTRGSL